MRDGRGRRLRDRSARDGERSSDEERKTEGHAGPSLRHPGPGWARPSSVAPAPRNEVPPEAKGAMLVPVRAVRSRLFFSAVSGGLAGVFCLFACGNRDTKGEAPSSASSQPSSVPAVSASAAPAVQDARPFPRRYTWSKNLAVGPPEAGRQKGETALAADGKGQVWLSFLDAAYRRARTDWLDYPRRVVLFRSGDDGRTFEPREDLSAGGTDERLAVDGAGLVATWKDWAVHSDRLVIAPIPAEGARPAAFPCMPKVHPAQDDDQTHLAVAPNGEVHVIGFDIGNSFGRAPDAGERGGLLYARWDRRDPQGPRCVDAQRLDSVGQLPKVVATAHGSVLIFGPGGWIVSADGGKSFGKRRHRAFGKEMDAALVDGDGVAVAETAHGGVGLARTDDDGATWKRAPVTDQSPGLTPAVHFEPGPGRGRVHVVWIGPTAERAAGGKASGAVFHAFSDDGGATFSEPARVSDASFPLHAPTPPPAPANQEGTWTGDYLAVTTSRRKVVVAWSDQRAGHPRSAVYVAVGE